MFDSKYWKGIVPDMITPFTPKGEVDVKGAKRLVDYLVKSGVHGLFALSSTGEYFFLSNEQKEVLIKTVVSQTKKRVSIYAGASSNSLKIAISNVNKLCQWGANAAVIIPPSFFTYSQEELIKYYTTIARNSPLPIFIYNIPLRAGVNMEISTLEKLSHEENILGTKDTTVDIARFMELLFHFRQRDDFSLFQGSELLLASSFIFGGDGVISALANVDPKLHLDIYQAAMNRDIEKAYQFQKKMNFLFTIFSAAGNPSLSINNFLLGIKITLNLLGICDIYVCQMGRKPRKEEINRVEQILLKRGLLRK